MGVAGGHGTTQQVLVPHTDYGLDSSKLVTKALVLGDFESAVELCLSSDRFVNALLLSLRLFQSIVTNDLIDIVQNADLQEWQEIFVVLCTFASKEEFSGLAEQLGRRLEFQYTIATSSSDSELAPKANDYRKYATLTYLASARLERLVNIWSEEMAEEQAALAAERNGSHYSAHAQALSATDYKDGDLALATAGAEADVKI
ncbi:hypothetical protein K435DRAFT_888813 [Dendrothele bispora CBS 962.96]|uniref:Uncharacterized protein n=1 Tax=Dendrothele bispora (strain CBS 962.96) TaxID=1314807 RepID=A0A4S8KS52_DENBC|nr:hypothetical protein K435DRAFT_888813 [Dendrothele bispora CBS 962.96]